MAHHVGQNSNDQGAPRLTLLAALRPASSDLRQIEGAINESKSAPLGPALELHLAAQRP